MKLKQIYEAIMEAPEDSKFGYHALIPMIESEMGIKVTDYLDGGTRSNIFTLSDGRLLKITPDRVDANSLHFAMQNPEYPIVKVYDMRRVITKELPKGISDTMKYTNFYEFYIAIVEQVDTISGDTSSEDYDDYELMDAVSEWFKTNAGTSASDVHFGNLGIRKGYQSPLDFLSPGLVLLDPNFRDIPLTTDQIPLLQIK